MELPGVGGNGAGRLRWSAGDRRALQLAWWRHRRTVLALVALFVGVTVLRAVLPLGDSQVQLLVAARDLAPGAVLRAADLRPVDWPAAGVPSGVLRSPAGLRLAGAVRAGEPITDVRVLGDDLLAGLPAGLVAVTVRPGAASATGLVHAGDRVDVLAATGSAGELAEVGGAEVGGAGVGGAGTGDSGERYSTPVTAQRIAAGARVLAVPGAGEGGTDGGSGGDTGSGVLGGMTGGYDPQGSGAGGGEGALVLAVDEATAARLLAAQVDGLIGIALLPEDHR